MASTPLRAVPVLRALLSNGMRALTSRTIASSSIYGNITRNPNKSWHTNQISINVTTTSFEQLRSLSAEPRVQELSPDVIRDPRLLERAVDAFEQRCQRNERVMEKDFIKIFDTFTRVAEHGSQDQEIGYTLTRTANLLLKCCGNLMFDTPPKGRELLAGNLWTFIKEKNIPIDISHYNSLLRVLNENNTTFDPQKILDEIKERNLIPDRITYQRLIHQYCLQGDISGATKLLESMKDANVELTEATFASLIIAYGKQDPYPSVNELFDLMRSNGVEPNAKAHVAALISLASHLSKDPAAAKVQLEELIESMQKEEVLLTPNDQIDLITHLGPLMSSNEAVAKFLENILDMNVSLGTKYKILTSLLRVNQFETASRIFWRQNTSERAIQRGNIGIYYLNALSTNHNVPADFVINECSKLEEKGWNKKSIFIVYRYAAESGRLDLVRACLKKIKDKQPMKAIFTWPLIAQAKDREEIVRVLREDLDPKLDTNELLETFSAWVWPKFADNVAEVFELNKELKFDGNVLMASYLNYSVQEDKIEQAIKFISEMPLDFINESSNQSEAQNDDDGVDDTRRTPRVNDRNNIIARLFEQIAEETKDAELLKKAYAMCSIRNQPMSSRSLAPLVRVHILNNDFNKALEEFITIAKEHRVTPCRQELMRHCLENKDPDNLQKIMAACTEIYGEQNSLFDLAVCCLENNKLRQAQKIFGSPGFRVRPARVYQTCRQMARNDKLDVLENYVNLVRDMYDVNQDFLYQILIDTYDRTSNAKRALNLWNLMQEEEFQPSKKSLVMIADLLERNNMEVPFQKPQLSHQDRLAPVI